MQRGFFLPICISLYRIVLPSTSANSMHFIAWVNNLSSNFYSIIMLSSRSFFVILSLLKYVSFAWFGNTRNHWLYIKNHMSSGWPNNMGTLVFQGIYSHVRDFMSEYLCSIESDTTPLGVMVYGLIGWWPTSLKKLERDFQMSMQHLLSQVEIRILDRGSIRVTNTHQ